jgi:hypothetical protein
VSSETVHRAPGERAGSPPKTLGMWISRGERRVVGPCVLGCVLGRRRSWRQRLQSSPQPARLRSRPYLRRRAASRPRSGRSVALGRPPRGDRAAERCAVRSRSRSPRRDSPRTRGARTRARSMAPPR